MARWLRTRQPASSHAGGATVEGRTAVARSGLGITSSGQLVWAAGERLLPAELGSAPVVPGQLGIAGELLEPDSRHFLTIIAS